MMRWRRAAACDRAAQWISLELDDELSVLERAALARHLERCDLCRAMRVEIGGLTGLLREAPAAEPARPILVAPPRRARQGVGRPLAAASVAAAATVAAGLAFQPGSGTPSKDALSFGSTLQQSRFAAEHVQTEPIVFLVSTPPVLSFASRALR